MKSYNYSKIRLNKLLNFKKKKKKKLKKLLNIKKKKKKKYCHKYIKTNSIRIFLSVIKFWYYIRNIYILYYTNNFNHFNKM